MFDEKEAEFASSLKGMGEKVESGTVSMSSAEDFLNSLGRFTVKHTYESTVDFLRYLGSPDKGLKIIHVAGTNGKGSVCAYLTSILLSAGYHVGTFTSPHIVDIRERFAIDNEMVEKAEFIRAFSHIFEQVHSYRASDNKRAEYFPTYFEYLFFMAMMIYQDSPIDYLILEVGLGGRLDATNSVSQTMLSVICEIGLDHMQYLGDTYAQIAGEKAGIIREGTPLVFFDKRQESTDVIRQQAVSMNAPYRIVSDSMIKKVDKNTTDACNSGITDPEDTGDGRRRIDFCYNSEYYKYVSLTLNTCASYQMQNAALAVTAAEELSKLGADINPSNIREGLANSFWTCRMEELRPGFFVDGAHNEDGMTAFLSSAGEIDCIGRKYLIFGVVADKQYMKMVSMILAAGIFDNIYAAVLGTGRTVSEDELVAAFDNGAGTSYRDCNVSFYDNVESAVKKALSEAEEDDQIYAAGSLYLAGQIREMIANDKF